GKKIPLTDGQAIRVYKNVPLAQARIDKGSAAEQVARGLAQALYQVMIGRQGGSGGSSTPSPAGGARGGRVSDTRPPDPSATSSSAAASPSIHTALAGIGSHTHAGIFFVLFSALTGARRESRRKRRVP